MQIKPDNQHFVLLGGSNQVTSVAVEFNRTCGLAMARDKSSLHHKG